MMRSSRLDLSCPAGDPEESQRVNRSARDSIYAQSSLQPEALGHKKSLNPKSLSKTHPENQAQKPSSRMMIFSTRSWRTSAREAVRWSPPTNGFLGFKVQRKFLVPLQRKQYWNTTLGCILGLQSHRLQSTRKPDAETRCLQCGPSQPGFWDPWTLNTTLNPKGSKVPM